MGDESRGFAAAFLKTRLPSEIARAQYQYLTLHYPLDEEGSRLLALVLFALDSRLAGGDVCIRLNVGSLGKVVDEWEKSQSFVFDDEEKINRREAVRLAGQILDAYYDRSKSSHQKASCDLPSANIRLKEAVLKLPCAGFEDEKGLTPLVVSKDRLYFRRYYRYEVKAADFILKNSKLPYFDNDKGGVTRDFIKKALNCLFGPSDDEVNWQKVAAAMASLRRFTIISGGPGTGKTTTVTRLLLLLLFLDPKLKKVLMCAPTGKAAARMAESMRSQIESLTGKNAEVLEELAALSGTASFKAEILDRLEVNAKTVHALIKAVPHKSAAIFNKNNPLECDILVADEVSMLDLSLFNRLIDALNDNTIVVMLGDRDQLNSVEAGSVLGDFCKRLSVRLSDSTLDKLSYLTGYPKDKLLKGKLSDEITLLLKSHRFSEESGIFVLSRLVNAADISDLNFRVDKLKPKLADKIRLIAGNANAAGSDGKDLRQIFAKEKPKLFKAALDEYLDVTWQEIGNSADKALTPEMAALKIAKDSVNQDTFGKDNYFHFLEYLMERDCTISDDEALEACVLLNRFRVLCSNRSGLLGQKNLNQAIEKECLNFKAINKTRENIAGRDWFAGRVVIITRNDPVLGMNNGDVGFAAYEKKAGEGTTGRNLRLFLQNDLKILKISPLFAASHDSGFAVTVHKSQGSEYDNVILALAEYDNEIISKELIYTGITRARKNVTIMASSKVLEQGLRRDAVRESGLGLRI